MAIREDDAGLFAATSDGVYKYADEKWSPFALRESYVTSIALSKNNVLAVLEKEELILLDRSAANVIHKSRVKIDEALLKEDIKLSRFVRDLHYGRGLFEGDMSLLFNDYGAIVMSFLPLSGFLIWWLIRGKKNARRLIKLHANLFVILAFIPIIIVAITGVFLDHSKALGKFMSGVNIPHAVLPPIYSTLRHDVWSVDYDGGTVRVGNRYGVYASKDFKEWSLESKGFAYAMIRKNERLFVSGMGSKNRLYNGEWNDLNNAPRMFKDVMSVNGETRYFSTHKNGLALPKFEDATLYSLLLTLHTGEFFASWWIWVNDFVAFALVVLGIGGTYRWWKKGWKRAK